MLPSDRRRDPARRQRGVIGAETTPERAAAAGIQRVEVSRDAVGAGERQLIDGGGASVRAERAIEIGVDGRDAALAAESAHQGDARRIVGHGGNGSCRLGVVREARDQRGRESAHGA